MPIDTNFSNNLKDFAEGRLDSTNYKQPQTPGQVFARMIVMEVVSDANSLPTSDKKKEWQALGVRNMQYVDVLPRNTILAKRIGEDVSPMFCFPFFPSHLALPCKPGECVWVMFEKPDTSDSDMAFWMCKIVEPHVADDVNHTHPGRSFEISFNPGTRERAQNEKQGTAESGENVWHELRNGPVVKIGDKRQTAVDNILLRGEKEDIFEKLITTTDASKLMTYESVPRFAKRPGDVVLEGSNNSLIVLGTDRKGPVTKSTGEFPAGSIDIVVGRGQTENTFGVQTSTTQMQGATANSKGPEIKKELNKSRDVLKQNEGNPDFSNDRSRILISQKTKPDLRFNLDSFNSTELDKATVFNKQKVEDSMTGDAGIVIKSDKVRLIARSDIEIIVSGYKEINSPTGDTIKDEDPDTDKWAAIVIKKNGDIVLRPSTEGYLKLGGDDANLAVLCSQAIPGPAGQVKGTPIVDTMGGTLGAEGALPTGQFSKKVLIM